LLLSSSAWRAAFLSLLEECFPPSLPSQATHHCSTACPSTCIAAACIRPKFMPSLVSSLCKILRASSNRVIPLEIRPQTSVLAKTTCFTTAAVNRRRNAGSACLTYHVEPCIRAVQRYTWCA
jgi:hypothetical protein